jgi:beta-galactosidase
MVFTLRQEGASLTGDAEGGGVSFSGGSDVPAPIMEGTVDGDHVSFKVGNSTYAGTVKGDRIELERTGYDRRRPQVAKESANRPAIGPPPDGSDPSRDPSFHVPPSVPVVLHRVQR